MLCLVVMSYGLFCACLTEVSAVGCSSSRFTLHSLHCHLETMAAMTKAADAAAPAPKAMKKAMKAKAKAMKK